MATIDLNKISDNQVIIHFGGQHKSIDTYTFANALISISDAIREINKEINPDYSIEIKIDALGAGSFRAQLITFKRKIPNLMKEGVKHIVLPLLVAFIWNRWFENDDNIQINVNDDTVIIEKGGDKIIIPRSVYDAKNTLKNSKDVEKNIGKAFSVLADDSYVTSFGIAEKIDSEEPIAEIPKKDFGYMARMAAIPLSENEKHRIIQERTNLVILKAILTKSTRKWEFVWKGIQISAPITDEHFFERLSKREFSFTQGDILDVELKILQKLDEDTGVYFNEEYEVTTVHNPVPMPRQSEMRLNDK